MRRLLMGLMVGCFGITGCGPDIRAICEGEIACEGGNDLDVEACVAAEEVDADYIADLGCGAEYNAYYSCIEPFLKCDKQPSGQICSSDSDCFGGGTCSGGDCVFANYAPGDDMDACEAERNAYNRWD